jgi:4'-phosphopantetheinyl transferase
MGVLMHSLPGPLVAEAALRVQGDLLHREDLAPANRPSLKAPRNVFEIAVIRPAVDSRTVRAAAAVLSRRERQRADRFAFDRDRCRFIVRRAALRRLLAARVGARPESLELVYGAHGKPRLAPGSTEVDLRFNVSSCDDLAAFAFSVGCEVGIDLEAVRASADVDDVAARFFSRAEYEAYLALEPRDRPLGFFQCWTRKEAFIKALGDGLTHPLDRFAVSLGPETPAAILRVENASVDGCGWRLWSFVPAPGFVAALVRKDRRSGIAGDC